MPQTYEATLIPGGAQLTGTIRDAAGSAVNGASVKALDLSGNLLAQVASTQSGRYEIGSLPDGSFRLQVEAPGFVRAEVPNLLAVGPKPIEQDVHLEVASVSQSVIVSAPKQLSRNVGSGGQLGRASGTPGLGQGNGYGTGSEGGTGGGVYRIDAARAEAEAAARSQALGDLFEYKLKDPITILKKSIGNGTYRPVAYQRGEDFSLE